MSCPGGLPTAINHFRARLPDDHPQKWRTTVVRRLPGTSPRPLHQSPSIRCSVRVLERALEQQSGQSGQESSSPSSSIGYNAPLCW